MMKPRYHTIQFICIIAVITIIALQGLTHFVKVKPLEGVVAKEQPIKLNIKTYLDGSYQNYLTEHAKRNTGFREFFIRNYNQLRYSCFGIVTNNNVVVGKNGELFTKMYLDEITGKRVIDNFTSVDSAKLVAQKKVKETLRLIDTLQRHGTQFLFVFAPSKASIYPEYIPKPYYDQLSDFSFEDYYVELFKENGIPHIDFNTYFKSIKSSFPYPLYSKYGTHWAFSTIPMVADSILRMMELILGEKMPSIEITDLNLTTDYFHQDRELEGQFNLLFPISKPPLPNPIFHLTDTVGIAKPNLFVIGDSYFVSFEKTSFLDAFSSWNYLKYNEYNISSNPKYNWKRWDVLADAYQILENADIVMAISTAPMLYGYMFGFIDTAFKLFRQGQYDEKEIERIIQAIHNTPEWYDTIVERAKKLGITTEENLRRNAIYVIESRERKDP